MRIIRTAPVSFDAHVLGYTPSGPQFDADISILPIDEIFATQNMRFPDGIQIYDITSAADAYVGTAQNMAIYGMVDLNVTNWWRLTAVCAAREFHSAISIGLLHSTTGRRISGQRI